MCTNLHHAAAELPDHIGADVAHMHSASHDLSDVALHLGFLHACAVNARWWPTVQDRELAARPLLSLLGRSKAAGAAQSHMCTGKLNLSAVCQLLMIVAHHHEAPAGHHSSLWTALALAALRIHTKSLEHTVDT